MVVQRLRYLNCPQGISGDSPRSWSSMHEAPLIAILAAGASRRLGQPKQLVAIGDEPLLRRQCRVALESRIGPVTIILGCRADQCATALAGLAVAVRRNDQWDEGI